MISPAYVAWRAEAEGMLWKQKPLQHFKGPVAVCMAFEHPKGLADLDGKQKGILDFLVRHAIIEEDNFKYVKMILASWDASVKGCKVTVSSMEG